MAQALGRPAGAAGPAHLRCVRTYTQLAAGFGVGAITVYRYIVEAVEILAVLAPDFMAASSAAKREASIA
ncbi:transposase family protein [Streptomyces sp. DHE17-7]|nr:transposase family protein [Streptomyces sp. DHE17-7]